MASVATLWKANPQKNVNYLLDTNVWLFILAGTTKNYQKSYIDFVSLIPGMPAEGRSKIILPSSVLSEIINRMMKGIFYEEFAKKFPMELDPKYGGKPNLLYKLCYRTHPQYETDFRMLLADMNAYKDHMVTISDDFAASSLDDLMDTPPIQLDFTDYTISQIARKSGFVIVTDDGDFKGDDNDILTVNKALLS